ncbi:hypothetical protein [Streptomyces sp. NPDC058382]|uniref:hypothetical protein n=1 Tax=unclassified Streptomyces TaxID=2593676 RepID=UPI003634EA38
MTGPTAYLAPDRALVAQAVRFPTAIGHTATRGRAPEDGCTRTPPGRRSADDEVRCVQL